MIEVRHQTKANSEGVLEHRLVCLAPRYLAQFKAPITFEWALGEMLQTLSLRRSDIELVEQSIPAESAREGE